MASCKLEPVLLIGTKAGLAVILANQSRDSTSSRVTDYVYLVFGGICNAKLCGATGGRDCLQYVCPLLQRTFTVNYIQRG